MDELRLLQKILTADLEIYNPELQRREFYNYSIYAHANEDSNYILIYDNNMYICTDFRTANEKIAKELEYLYRKVVGGTTNSDNGRNNYNIKIEKEGNSITIRSRYVDIFESLLKKLEEAIEDKYDTRARFEKNSVINLDDDRYVIEEVHLCKAKDFRNETENYKYEYEYVLIGNASGNIKKLRESKLVEIVRDE